MLTISASNTCCVFFFFFFSSWCGVGFSRKIFPFIRAMETSRICRWGCILLLWLTMAPATFITPCDARRSMGMIKKDLRSIIKATKKLKVMKHIDGDPSSNTGPYGVSSPFSLPPFDSLSPFPQPEIAPPYCIYPPFTPQPPPSTTIPSPSGSTPSISTPYIPPILPFQSPPPSPIGIVPGPPESVPVLPPPSPMGIVPSPPEIVPSPFVYTPSPPGPILTPPYYEPSPPSINPSPPSSVPSPTGFFPSPPVFQPPVVYPPPTGPPSPRTSPSIALWCVAKPTVPDPIIQEAMNYACGSGADCGTIQPSGSCFEPDTIYAHASYAFNSYWQRTKVAGGTCSFGGTAMLVTVDPSHDGCHYMYY